ncbi:hypothetical protein [Marinomonas transparens]|uniref:Uncharacterized protein n=1 Tax=Marinomonas transparens TaxID=2795388 RepID=A0A934N040_9GAMM|nr:hypothetical protein [Marinomonas transparens]MBJ7536332.1 hypothetical protein [Marinomonas transparens]
MPYLEPFIQQWKTYLKQQLSQCGLNYVVTDVGDSFDIKANSVAYFRWLRTANKINKGLHESRDELVWIMLEKQLRALANKAEKGTSNLVSRLHFDESQIQIRLNFSYDDEQHIFYVS